LGIPERSTVYALPVAPDLAKYPPDLHQGLVLLLVDGQRAVERLCSDSPLSDDLTLSILRELAGCGLVEEYAPAPEALPAQETPEDTPDPDEPVLTPGVWIRKPRRKKTPKAGAVWVNPKQKAKKPAEEEAEAEDKQRPYLCWRLLECDLEDPPAEVRRATPVLTGEIDPGDITGEAEEFFLLSRIDGSTTVESLQAISGMSMPFVLQRLAKHKHMGTVGFAREFADEWLVPAGSAEPATASEPEAAPKADPATAAQARSTVVTRMVDDPSLSGPLRRTGVALPQGGGGVLSPQDLLVMSVLTSASTVGEVVSGGPGDTRQLLLTLLDLYCRGEVVFEPPERGELPAWVGAEAPTPTPDDVLKVDGADVVELDYDSGPQEGDTYEVDYATGPIEGAPLAAPPDDVFEVDYTTAEYAIEDFDDRPGAGPADTGDTQPEIPFVEYVEQKGTEKHDTTKEFFSLPKTLFRGKDEEGYERAWRDISYKGDLSNVAFSRIFDFVHDRSSTGILHVRRGGDHQNVWFLRGQPVAASSTEAEDALGSLLWKAGQIDKETYLNLQRQCAQQPDEPEWKVLQQLFVLVPDEIQEARRRQVVHIVARLFGVRMGQYLFVGKQRLQSDLQMLPVDMKAIRAVAAGEEPAMAPAARQPARPSPPGVPAAPQLAEAPVLTTLAEGEEQRVPTLSSFVEPPAVGDEPPPAPEPPPPEEEAPPTPPPEKRVPPGNLAEWLQENFDLYVVVPPEALGSVASLRIGERERRLLDALAENRHRLREALAMSSLGRVKTHQFMAALWGRSYIDFVEEVDQEDEALRNLASLDKALVRMEKGDLFHALGCHASATYKELTLAHKKEKARFAPERFLDREPAFQKSIARVNVVLDRAYNHLQDTARRRRYRMDHFGETRLSTFADVQMKKADVFLFFKQEYATARDLYESAWDLVPSNPRHLAFLGYAHFRTYMNEPSERDRGVGMVEKALSVAKKDARVLLVAAMLEKDRNNQARQRHFMAEARKLVPSAEDFRKILKSFRLDEGV